MNFIEKLTLPENLYWAWAKARQVYLRGDAWYDPIELAHFEANLESELLIIANQFRKLNYSIAPLKPLSHPKKNDINNERKARQYFWISTRDQVAWLAFINVVGPMLDDKMPSWSYGHRLYRSVWWEPDNEEEKLKIGRYRHSSGQLYRTFQQGWSRYRRHIFLTVRAMTGFQEREVLDETNERLLREELYLPENLKQPYLNRQYWRSRFAAPPERIYWGAIDFELFYPSIKKSSVLENLKNHASNYSKDIHQLAGTLLNFPLDLTGFSNDELRGIELTLTQSKFTGIPTGLFVAGFLANVAMLQVDMAVTGKLIANNVAHFRFVDDHVVLAKSFDELICWLKDYDSLLQASNIGAKIKFSKTTPKELSEYWLASMRQKNGKRERDTKEEAIKATKLDPQFPSPLMTKTLEVVSDIARTEIKFDLLDDREQDHLITDIEHLLLTEFPEGELKAETRVAFAATRLSRLIPRRVRDNTELSDLLRDIEGHKRTIEYLNKKIRGLCSRAKENCQAHCSSCDETTMKLPICREIDKLNISIKNKNDKLRQFKDGEKADKDIGGKYVFSLLIKTLHEYPYKLRLWTRVLQFCQYMGYPGINDIFVELSYLAKQNPVTTSYIRAFVGHIIAEQVVKCALNIIDNESLTRKRQASLAYLRSVILEDFLHPENDDMKYYEKISGDVVKSALGVAKVILVNSEITELITKDDLYLLEAQINKLDAYDWVNFADDWSAKTKYSLAVWCWWAENISTPKECTEPGLVWKSASCKLAVHDSSSWAVWAKYPKCLPNIALKQLITKGSGFGKKYLNNRDLGWLYDVLRGLDTNKLNSLKSSGNPHVLFVIKAIENTTAQINLTDWIEWTREKYERDSSDPRISEWTALAIISQVAIEISRFDQFHKRKLISIHPANVTLPKQWVEMIEYPLTWESWKSKIEAGKHIHFKNRNLICDSRYVPIWGDGMHDLEWGPVRGLGMLLLSLVSRTVDWPAIWNPHGQQRAWTHLVRKRIQQAGCSSWTSAILEACLGNRPRESFLLPQLFNDYNFTDDTTKDPPKILTLDDLISYLNKAKKILTDYQLTAFNHMPRQLVPIKLEQLTRTTWIENVEEGAQT